MKKDLQFDKIVRRLDPYTPHSGVSQTFARWLVTHNVSLKITDNRISKLGDYRSPRHGKGHQISINGTLNPYAFTITFIHEMAHLYTWKNTYLQKRVEPHGVEWQRQFQELMLPFLQVDTVFPKDIRRALWAYMLRPAAATCRDTRLMKHLMIYDSDIPQGYVHLSDLPNGTWFQNEQGRVFRKMHLLRKNIRCEEYKTGALYNIVSYIWAKPIEEPIDHNPKADREKQEELYKIQLEQAGFTTLSQIPIGGLFRDKKGRVYQKKKLLRVNFQCVELHSGRLYNISPNYPVQELDIG